MEFVNTNLKKGGQSQSHRQQQTNSNPHKGKGGGGGGGGAKNNNNSNNNNRRHSPQGRGKHGSYEGQQQQSKKKWTKVEYQQFIEGAKERGQGGHSHFNGIIRLPQSSSTTTAPTTTSNGVNNPNTSKSILQEAFNIGPSTTSSSSSAITIPNAKRGSHANQHHTSLASLFNTLAIKKNASGPSGGASDNGGANNIARLLSFNGNSNPQPTNSARSNSKSNSTSSSAPQSLPLLSTPPSSQDELTKRYNNETLLRMDSAFVVLIGSASHVVIYDYNMEGQDWIDTMTSGPLFLYRRARSPEFGMVVLNRKGVQNLIIHFDKESQIIPQPPYLLFRRGEDEVIKGIYVYKEAEFQAVTSLFRMMGVEFDKYELAEGSSSSAGSEIQTQAQVHGTEDNVFSVFQQGPMKTDLPSKSNKTTKTKVVTAEELEQEMFSEPSRSGKGETGANGGVSLLQKLTTAHSASDTKSNALEAGEGRNHIRSNLINGDGSRSMRTVEQLEKQLKPQETSATDMSNELLQTLGIKPMRVESSAEASPFLTPTSRSISDSERSHKRLTVDDLDGRLFEETDPDIVREVVESLTDLTELSLLSENVPGHGEPQLVWRKRSNLQNRPSSALVQIAHPNGDVGSENRSAIYMQGVRPRAASPSPASNSLNPAQLQQAITYLFETDPSFIQRIHEAYVKSLQHPWPSSRLG